LDNILSLCAALLDKSEASPEGDAEAEKALRRVAELARQWLPSYGTQDKPIGNAKLNLFLAQALQSLGERAKDQSELANSEQAYNLAIAGLTANKDPDGRLTDAKSGLAAVLQVLGEADHDADKLRRAVGLHKELVDASRSTGGSKEEAGPLENLAGSLMSLAGVVDRGEAMSLYGEAKTALERVILIHQRQGDGDAEQLARQSLDDIENALAQL
jgi:tetratricopeptide (TPR) repeat protein